MTTPKVSVIIPVYDVEKYVAQCVESVLNQTLSELEVICIDDGSTDDSLSILNELAAKDSRVKVFTQSNRGLGATRNVGLGHAAGEYIHFLDADDFMTKSAYEILVSKAERLRLDVLSFEIEPVLEESSLVERYERFVKYYKRNGVYTESQSGKKLLALLVANNDWLDSACIHLIRRDYLERSGIRFLEGVKFEDNCFTFELILGAHQISIESGVAYQRTVREGSIMTSPPEPRDAIDRMIVAINMVRIIKAQSGLTADESSAAFRILRNVVRAAERIIEELPEEQRDDWMETDVEPALLLLLENARESTRLRGELSTSRKALKTLKSSNSTKFGRALGALFRWLNR